jgi:site-specific recombinase XerD
MADVLIEKRHGDLVRDIAGRIAQQAPRLADLGEEQLEKLARVVVAEGLRDELKTAVKLAKIPYRTERERFLERASRTGSQHTVKAYRAGLTHLEAWCADKGLPVLELTPAQADDWIESEKARGLSSATVRLWVSGASAFWTWLERRHSNLRNPFRGTRSRPIAKPVRKLAVPSDLEIRELEAAADPVLRAAIVMMSQAGLRVGGLPGLSILGARWNTTTKGKQQAGKVPEEARAVLERAGLPLRSPFSTFTADQLRMRFAYLVSKLHADGKLRERYSVHDLRHAFAVRFYESTHDVYQVEKALGHANVSVTEGYLRSLGLE